MSRAREERTIAYGKVTVGRPRTDRPGEYHGTIEPLPDFLTDEQLVVFDRVEAAGDVSVERVQIACRRVSVEVPDAAVVTSELDLRADARAR
jgi:hypothetical protein